jgi:hypothetical protein
VKSIIAQRTCRQEQTKAPTAVHRFPAASTFAFLYMPARFDAVVLSAHITAILGCCSGSAVILNVASGTSRPGHCPTLPDVPASYSAAVFSEDVTAILRCCSGSALIQDVAAGASQPCDFWTFSCRSAGCDAVAFSAHIAATLGCCSDLTLIRNVPPGERLSEARRPGPPGRRRRPSDAPASIHRHSAGLPLERMAEGTAGLGGGQGIMTRFQT